MKNDEKVTVAWNLWKSGIRPNIIAKQTRIDKATVYRWIKDFRYLGIQRTLSIRSSCMSRPQTRKVNQIVKNRIYRIRQEKHQCCGEKIRYYYKKEFGSTVSVGKIYEVLGEKYTLRTRYKPFKYGEAPVGICDRDVVQGDTVDFGDVYAFTYVDTFNRQCFVDLELSLEALSGYASLIAVSEVFGWINLIQTDGGPEFGGAFSKNIFKYASKYRVSRPYKKNEQSYIESFNRTLRKECFGWGRYKASEISGMIIRAEEFMKFYNNERPHLGLDMKIPNDIASCRICG